MKFTYVIECDNGAEGPEGPYEARMVSMEVDGEKEELERTPFRAYGSSPILAVAAMGLVAKEWADGGSERWMGTADGKALRDEVMFGIERPKKGTGASN